MSWSGEVVFGEAWAAYRGPASESTPHAHAALQIIAAADGQVVLELESGRRFAAPALLIRPSVVHAVAGGGPVAMIYVEPQAPLAFALLDQVGPEEVEPLPPALAGCIDHAAPPAAWFAALQAALPAPSRRLDPRIGEVLAWLAADPGGRSIAAAAAQAGLSESHLRTLVRAQLGLPLSTWLVWRKLERAARELAGGAGLAQAALAGGFADQAHCARSMRRMFGVTPGMAREALR